MLWMAHNSLIVLFFGVGLKFKPSFSGLTAVMKVSLKGFKSPQ